MKPLLQDIELLLKDSIHVKEIRTSSLNDQFHFHNVHEIALILKGSGKRIVGDSIEYFTDGDLVFIGRLLPHASYIENKKFSAENCQDIHALVIYFHPNWFSENVLNSPDFRYFIKLMKKIERGIKIFGNTKAKTSRALIKLKNSQGFERIIRLLDILDFVSKSDEYEFLASESYSNSYSQDDVQRLSEVYRYIMGNFTDVIKLEEVSSIANMTATSFCKYFKNKTGKTFTGFVNEVRIGQASKMLLNVNQSISEVCFRCGFNNLTNFNRNFKRFTKRTPSEYKTSFLGIHS